MKQQTAPLECPRCNEADERSTGINRCGLCECEFFVGSTGKTVMPTPEQLAAFRKIVAQGGVGGGSDNGGNNRSSFG